jgi:hypothetical protein
VSERLERSELQKEWNPDAGPGLGAILLPGAYREESDVEHLPWKGRARFWTTEMRQLEKTHVFG